MLMLPLLEPKTLSKSCSSVASAELLEEDEEDEVLSVAVVLEPELSCDAESLSDELDSLLADGVDAPSACARASRASARSPMPPDEALPSAPVCVDEDDEAD